MAIASMAGLPTLIIGVGGTGLKVLQRVKERLMETYYGEVPQHITLLELDTALQSPADNFCGVQLNQEAVQARTGTGFTVQEMQLIQTKPTYTMDHVFSEAEQGDPRWSWIETNRLKSLLPPAGRSILEGAGAYRPVGRTAFFLNYPEVKQRLQQAMQQVVSPQIQNATQYLQAQEGVQTNQVNLAAAKRNIFLVSSLAGGTGSGAMLDVAAMLRSMRDNSPNFSNIVLIGLIAMPRFFTEIHDAIGRRVPNTYAGLREIDRFLRGHAPATPYDMMGGNKQVMRLENTLFDLTYLVDVQDYYGNQLSTKAEYGALPVMSDMIIAHTDMKLGLRLNAANINVPSNYHQPTDTGQTNRGFYRYQSNRYYSAMNAHTVIFPREDVIKSLSLRFLIDLVDNHLIRKAPRSSMAHSLEVPTTPIPVEEVIRFLSQDDPSSEEKTDAGLSTQQGDIDMGIFVRTLLKEAQNARRAYDTEMDSVLGWLLEDASHRQQVKRTINESITSITSSVEDKKDMNQYVSKVDRWLNHYLGPLNDPNIPLGDRSGGAWERAFGNLVTEARPTMMARVNELVLRILNQRHYEDRDSGESRTSILRANRPGYALAVLRALKEQVRNFEEKTQASYSRINLTQARKDLQEARGAVTSFRGGLFARNPGPDYLTALRQLAEAERQRLLRNLVLQMTQQFGGDIAEEGRQRSVLDVAIRELEEWVTALTRVRELLAHERERHEARRKEKYAIMSRSYVTDPGRFPNAGRVEDGLYERLRPDVWKTLLGPDPMGGSGAGFYWEPREGGEWYFDYAIMTKEKPFQLNPSRPQEVVQHPMLGVGSGVEGIVNAWQEGAFRMFAERVRGDKEAHVAAYIKQLNPSQMAFVNHLIDPNSRALIPLVNTVQPNDRQKEHYLAVDPTSDDKTVADFYNWFRTSGWQDTGKQYLESESDVACTFLTLYHGLEIDHIQSFVECEPAYRTVNINSGCLHLFREEQLAADYEARIPLLKVPAWMNIKNLHPEVIVCLNDAKKVRSFALALMSGLIKLEATDQNPEYFLTLPKGDPLRLSASVEAQRGILNYELMQDTDKVAARLLQAFQTFMLRGHAIGVEYGEHQEIDYDAIMPAFNAWFQEAHGDTPDSELDTLLETWKSREPSEGPGLYPLFNAESKDPRFRDLGIVLFIELRGWRDTKK